MKNYNSKIKIFSIKCLITERKNVMGDKGKIIFPVIRVQQLTHHSQIVINIQDVDWIIHVEIAVSRVVKQIIHVEINVIQQNTKKDTGKKEENLY